MDWEKDIGSGAGLAAATGQPWLALLPMGIELGKTLFGASAAKKNKPELFENTQYGQYLAQLARTGMLSPRKMSAINTILNTQMGGASNIAKADILGSQIRGGMEGSVAASEPYAKLGIARQRALASTGTNLMMLNEQSKQEAGLALAQGKDISRDQRRDWRAQYYNSLIGGLAGAAQTGLAGYGQYQGEQYARSPQGLQDSIVRLLTEGKWQAVEMLLDLYGGDDADAGGTPDPYPWGF